jgi:hypothetical protein
MFGSAAPLQERLVRVKLLVDSRLTEEDRSWREAVRKLIGEVSEYYQDHFAIRFAVTSAEAWEYPGETPFTSDLMVDLKRRVPEETRDGSYELVLGLTRQRIDVRRGRARVDRIGDCHEGLGSYIVSSMSVSSYRGREDLEIDATALIHEVGHIFGARHTDDPDSIMNQHFRYRTDFDRPNREIIMENRFCPFRDGTP